MKSSVPLLGGKGSVIPKLAIAMTLILVFVFVALPWFVSRYFLTPQWLEEQVFPELEERFGRDISLERLEVGYRGLRLGGLSIAEDPSFSGGGEDFVTLGGLDVEIRWLSLLRGELSTVRVVLKEPVINVRRNDAGELNVASLLDRVSAGTEQAQVADGAGEGDQEIGPIDTGPIVVNAALEGGRLDLDGLSFSELRARLRLVNDKLKLLGFSAAVARGEIRGSAEINLGVAGLSYGATVAADGVRLEDLAAVLGDQKAKKLGGRLSFSSTFTGKGTLPASMERHLSGFGSFEIDDGEFGGSTFLSRVAALTGVDAFHSLKLLESGGEFTIDKGRASSERVVLGNLGQRIVLMGDVGLDGTYALEAWAGINTKSIRVSVPAYVRPLLKCEIEEYDLNRDGKTDERVSWQYIPFAVGGSFDNPRVAFPKRAFTPSDLVVRFIGDSPCAGGRTGSTVPPLVPDRAKAGFEKTLGALPCVPIPFVRSCD